MSILNIASDGLFNVAIVLTRALIRLGPKSREDLLEACGLRVDAVDPTHRNHLNQTLTRWTELGLFAIEDNVVSVREPYRTEFG